MVLNHVDLHGLQKSRQLLYEPQRLNCQVISIISLLVQ